MAWVRRPWDNQGTRLMIDLNEQVAALLGAIQALQTTLQTLNTTLQAIQQHTDLLDVPLSTRSTPATPQPVVIVKL